MLGFLFRRLTDAPEQGTALFDAVTTVAREPHWYVQGAVPDTIDGRFAVLSTILALTLVRIEQFGDEGNELSVTLTERFITVMESEHRELGLGDPTLGKTVRKLVGSLSRRTALWRNASAGRADWTEATRDSLYKDEVAAGALDHSSAATKAFWARLQDRSLESLAAGDVG